MKNFSIGYVIGMGIVSIIFATQMGKIDTAKSEKPITPTIEINCINEVCDTTYIYKSDYEK